MTPTRQQKQDAVQTAETVALPGDGSPTEDAPTAPPLTPDQPAMIGHHQQRAMAAALRDHGITTDAAVYDYLSAYVGREVTSRKELTTTEAAHIIRDLIDNPPTTNPLILTDLRASFPEEAIGQLPRSTCRDCSQSPRKRCDAHQWVSRCQVCGNSHSSASMHISFVGHADVTARLLEVDPLWTWRPMTSAELDGIPPVLRNGLWIMLTIGGVTRPGFGDTENGKGPKEAIGDALRNAAMRFGVALELWAKGDREWAHADKTGAETMHPDEAPPRQSAPDLSRPPTTLGPDDWTLDPEALALTAELLTDLEALATRAGTDLAGITAKWRNDQGGVSVGALRNIAPMTLAPLVDQIKDYLDKQTAPA